MLADAKMEYVDLFETTDITIVTKKSKKKTKSSRAPTTVRIYLKQSLSKDKNTIYYVGSNITGSDLKLKNRTGAELLSGHQMVDMAKKGLRDFRKAMTFTGDR